MPDRLARSWPPRSKQTAWAGLQLRASSLIRDAIEIGLYCTVRWPGKRHRLKNPPRMRFWGVDSILIRI